MQSRAHAPSLFVPFAVLGLAGGWAAGDLHALGRDAGVRILLCVVTPIVCGGLGPTVAKRLGDPPLIQMLWFCVATVIAGVVNGFFVGLGAGTTGAILGAVWGAICSLPFLPVLGIVVVASRRAARARRGSVLRVVHGRGVASATLLACVLTSAVPLLLDWRASPSALLGLFTTCAAISGISLLSLLDLLAFVRIRGAGGAAWRLRESEAPLPEGAVVDDIGAGEELWEQVEAPLSPYRSAERAVRFVRGSFAEVRRVLGCTLLRRACALGLAAVALVLQLDRADVWEQLRGGALATAITRPLAPGSETGFVQRSALGTRRARDAASGAPRQPSARIWERRATSARSPSGL